MAQVLTAARLALPLASASLGCGRHAPADPQRPLEVLVSSPPEVLDPRLAADAISMRVTRLLHAGLFRLDESLLPVPYVAREYHWQPAEHEGAGPTLIVELRDDVYFTNGAPVRADDVVATLRSFQAEGSRHRRVVEAIGEARAESPTRVRIPLIQPHGTLLSDLELPILRADQAAAGTTPRVQLDGLGPYRLGARSESAVELLPRDGGALPRPAHAVSVRTVRDENARAMRLQTDAADVVPNGIGAELLPAFARFPDVQVQSRPGANLTYLVVRHGPGAPLDPLPVRRALSLALDRDELCQSFFAGHAKPARGALPPMHWAHDAEAAPLAHDPAQARLLLEQAGQSRASFTLSTTTDPRRLTLARSLAQAWTDLGLQVRVEPLELGVLLARLGRGDFDVALLQIPELTEPNALRTFLHSGSVPPLGANRGRYLDAELDAALDRGQAHGERAARERDYREVQRLIVERLPIVPLWHEDQIVLTGARTRGFLPSAEGRWLDLARF